MAAKLQSLIGKSQRGESEITFIGKAKERRKRRINERRGRGDWLRSS